MKSRYFVILAIPLILLLTACQSAPSRPCWITLPGDGVVISTAPHVLGEQRQYDVALNKAQARLAELYRVGNPLPRDVNTPLAREAIPMTVRARWRDSADGTL